MTSSLHTGRALLWFGFGHVVAIVPVNNPNNINCDTVLAGDTKTVSGHETWPLIGRHHPFVIGLPKYLLPRSQLIKGARNWCEFPPFFSGHWQSPYTTVTAGNMPDIRVVQWDCERVCEAHYNDIIMSAMASQITSLTIVYSIVSSGADQRKHQSSASLAFVWGIHWSPVNSPYEGPVTRKMFPFDDVIMIHG